MAASSSPVITPFGGVPVCSRYLFCPPESSNLNCSGGTPPAFAYWLLVARGYQKKRGSDCSRLLGHAPIRKPPFPDIQSCFLRRPGAVRGAKRRSEPLTARTDAGSLLTGKGGPHLTARFQRGNQGRSHGYVSYGERKRRGNRPGQMP
jgi:hypothetical protein